MAMQLGMVGVTGLAGEGATGAMSLGEFVGKLEQPPAVQPYEVGGWGPAAAAKLLAGYSGWRGPWLEA
jgi:hypothetical protein